MRAETMITLTEKEQEILSRFYGMVSDLDCSDIDIEELLADIDMKNETSINNVIIVYER